MKLIVIIIIVRIISKVLLQVLSKVLYVIVISDSLQVVESCMMGSVFGMHAKL